jgi:hypothetical protein
LCAVPNGASPLKAVKPSVVAAYTTPSETAMHCGELIFGRDAFLRQEIRVNSLQETSQTRGRHSLELLLLNLLEDWSAPCGRPYVGLVLIVYSDAGDLTPVTRPFDGPAVSRGELHGHDTAVEGAGVEGLLWL